MPRPACRKKAWSPVRRPQREPALRHPALPSALGLRGWVGHGSAQEEVMERAACGSRVSVHAEQCAPSTRSMGFGGACRASTNAVFIRSTVGQCRPDGWSVNMCAHMHGSSRICVQRRVVASAVPPTGPSCAPWWLFAGCIQLLPLSFVSYRVWCGRLCLDSSRALAIVASVRAHRQILKDNLSVEALRTTEK